MHSIRARGDLIRTLVFISGLPNIFFLNSSLAILDISTLSFTAAIRWPSAFDMRPGILSFITHRIIS